jgi:hypothetical protein
MCPKKVAAEQARKISKASGEMNGEVAKTFGQSASSWVPIEVEKSSRIRFLEITPCFESRKSIATATLGLSYSSW